MNPQFPVYIASKGRADSRITVRTLEALGVPYRVIIEQPEWEAYAAVIDPANLLVLDPAFQRDYDPCDELGDSKSKGPGPARNFAWAHAISQGAAWHWVMDDNISNFDRLHQNLNVHCADGTVLRCMEDFVLRYKNVAMAGPAYDFFVPRKRKFPPFILNTRIFSCILIRNDIPFRWRARYNEDTDLSLRVLKAGWCTIEFNVFQQHKATTQTVKGGNLDEFYSTEGTLPKSRMLARLHPDVARLMMRYGRWHHYVDYKSFQRNNKLLRKEGVPIETEANNYGMQLVQLAAPAGAA
jgi:hypothetical protein